MSRNELPGLQMTVPSDSLGIIEFACEVIEKNKSLVEEVEVLQNTDSDEKSVLEGFEK